MEKGEIAHNEQFLLFPQCFKDLYYRQLKTKVCLGKDLLFSNFFFSHSVLKTYITDW